MSCPAGDFRQCDLEELPFADETFDVVTGFNSLQYAGNPVAALREVGRVAKRGGSVVVNGPGREEQLSMWAARRANG
jgi:ubiquinone/menaquinone biosynthesis C-methylase UbiE